MKFGLLYGFMGFKNGLKALIQIFKDGIFSISRSTKENRILYSEDVTNVAYSTYQLTRVSPTLLRETTSSSIHNIQQGSVVFDKPYMRFEVIVKPTGVPWIVLGGISNGYCFFNLVGDGSVGNNFGVTYEIELLPDGFYRCSIYYTTPITGTFELKISLSNANGNYSYVGDVNNTLEVRRMWVYAESNAEYAKTTNQVILPGLATAINNGTGLPLNLQSGCPVVIAAGNELTFSTPNSNEFVYQSDIESGIIETQSTGTTFVGSQGTFDFMVVLNSTKQLSANDILLLENNPYLIVECATGKTGHGLSIVQADIKYWYVPNLVGGATIKDGNGLSDIVIPSYLQATNYDASKFNTKGIQTVPLTIDISGKVTDILYSRMNFSALCKVLTETRTLDADITIEITPGELPFQFMSTTVSGAITMNADGTVNSSNGSVVIDTGTLSVGVKSLIKITNISIDGETTINSGLGKFILHDYIES